jgi:2',3'-cyclic-nucleotide 2'-phosphodiesterase (5'-nucleotidase family)
MNSTLRRAIRNALYGGCALAAATAGSAPALAVAPVVDFKIQILHASDLEGGIDAIKRAPNFAAVVERLEQVAAAEDPPVPSVVLSAGDNWIPGPFFSASGDSALRTPLRNACAFAFGQSCAVGGNNVREGAGRVDVMIMSILGLDASALGNHEFDLGTGVVLEAIGSDIRSGGNDPRWYGTPFPYLSANLDFSGDANLSPLFEGATLPNTRFVSSPTNRVFTTKIAPATTIEVTYNGNAQKIGVVGATTPVLESISSPGAVKVKNPGTPPADDMAALAGVLQPVIDDVIAGDNGIAGDADDINKVVLVSHLQQLSRELALAPLLRGVDVILAGGSDTRLADGNDDLGGAPSGGDYPQVVANADGHPVLVVSTDGEYSYVGRLLVAFDANGVVVGPLVPETDSDPNVIGAYASTDAVVTALWGSDDPFADGVTKGDAVKDLVSAVQTVVNTKDADVKGETAVYIEGRREKVRTEETNLGNLSADANLAYARTVDATTVVSIKNGGGIRNPIGETKEAPPGSGSYVDVPPGANPDSGKLEGQVSHLDIENSLRFNNQLSLVTATAAELKGLIEHGVAATAPGATPGQFPQVGGIAFSFDPAFPAGQRVQSLVVTNPSGAITDVVVKDGKLLGDPNRRLRIVTLNFLAGGGDSYPFPGLSRPDRVDTGKGEQAALGDLFAANHPERADPGDPQPASAYGDAETAPADDTRIQNLGARGDTVLAAVRTAPGLRGAVNGTADADVLMGGVGTNAITTGAGTDRVLFSSLRDGRDVVADFVVGEDKLVLNQLLKGIGYTGSNPLTDGTVKVMASGASSVVLVDPDQAGPGRGIPLAVVTGVAAAALNSAKNFEF